MNSLNNNKEKTVTRFEINQPIADGFSRSVTPAASVETVAPRAPAASSLRVGEEVVKAPKTIKTPKEFCECVKLLHDALFYAGKGIPVTIECHALSKWFGLSCDLKYYDNCYMDFVNSLDTASFKKYMRAFKNMFGCDVNEYMSDIDEPKVPELEPIEDETKQDEKETEEPENSILKVSDTVEIPPRQQLKYIKWETNYSDYDDSDLDSEITLKFDEEEKAEQKQIKDDSSRAKHDLAYVEYITECEKRAIIAEPFNSFIRKVPRKTKKDTTDKKLQNKTIPWCHKTEEEKNETAELKDPTLKAINDEIIKVKQVEIPLNTPEIKSTKPAWKSNNIKKNVKFVETVVDKYEDIEPPIKDDSFKPCKVDPLVYNKNTIEESVASKNIQNTLENLHKELTEEENREIYDSLGLPYPEQTFEIDIGKEAEEPIVKVSDEYESKRIWTLHAQDEKESSPEVKPENLILKVSDEVKVEPVKEPSPIPPPLKKKHYICDLPEIPKNIIEISFSRKYRQDVFMVLYGIKRLPTDIIRYIFGFVLFATSSLEKYTCLYTEELVPKVIVQASIICNLTGWYNTDDNGNYIEPRYLARKSMTQILDMFKIAVDRRRTWLSSKKTKFQLGKWHEFSVIKKKVPDNIHLSGEVRKAANMNPQRIYATNEQEAFRIFTYNGLVLLQDNITTCLERFELFKKLNNEQFGSIINIDQLVEDIMNTTYEPYEPDVTVKGGKVIKGLDYSLEDCYYLFIDVTVRLYPRIVELLESYENVPELNVADIDEKKCIGDAARNLFRLVCLYWSSEWRLLHPALLLYYSDNLSGRQIYNYIMGIRKKMIAIINNLENKARKLAELKAAAEPKDDYDKKDEGSSSIIVEAPSTVTYEIKPVILKDVTVAYEPKYPKRRVSFEDFELPWTEIDYELTLKDIALELQAVRDLKARLGKTKKSNYWRKFPVQPYGKQKSWQPVEPSAPDIDAVEHLYKQYYDWCVRNHWCFRFRNEFHNVKQIQDEWDLAQNSIEWLEGGEVTTNGASKKQMKNCYQRPVSNIELVGGMRPARLFNRSPSPAPSSPWSQASQTPNFHGSPPPTFRHPFPLSPAQQIMTPFNTPRASSPFEPVPRAARRSRRVHIDPWGPNVQNLIESSSFMPQPPPPQEREIYRQGFGLGINLISDHPELYNEIMGINEPVANIRRAPDIVNLVSPSVTSVVNLVSPSLGPVASDEDDENEQIFANRVRAAPLPYVTADIDPESGDYIWFKEKKKRGRPKLPAEQHKYQKKYSRRGAPTKAEREEKRLAEARARMSAPLVMPGQLVPPPAPRLGPVEPSVLETIEEKKEDREQTFFEDDVATYENARNYDTPLADQLLNVRKKDVHITDEVLFSTHDFIFRYNSSGLSEALTGNIPNFTEQTRHMRSYIENVMAGERIVAWRYVLNYNGPNDRRSISSSFTGDYTDAFNEIIQKMIELFLRYHGEENVTLEEFVLTIRTSDIMGMYGGKSTELKQHIDEFKSQYTVINPHSKTNCLWTSVAIACGYKEHHDLLNEFKVQNKAGEYLKRAIGTKNYKGGNRDDVRKLSYWKNRPIVVYNPMGEILEEFCPEDIRNVVTDEDKIKLLLWDAHYHCLLPKDDPIVKEHYDQSRAEKVCDLEPIEPKSKEYEGRKIVVYDLEAYREPHIKERKDEDGKTMNYEEIEQIAYACGWAFMIDMPPRTDLDEDNELERTIWEHECNTIKQKWRDKGYEVLDYDFHGKMVTAAYQSIKSIHCLDDALFEWMTEPYFHNAVFYAHNGGKYDIRLFLGQSNMLYREDYYIVAEEQIELNGRIINLGIKNITQEYKNEGKTVQHHISIRDSIPIFGPSKLSKLCDEFNVPHKKMEEKISVHELMFANTWEENWTKYGMEDYFRNDCLGLLELLEDFNTVCVAQTGIPITAVNTGASLAKKFFLTHYYKCKWDLVDEENKNNEQIIAAVNKAQNKMRRRSRKSVLDPKKTIYTLTKDMDAFIREGYGGGRCEAFVSKAINQRLYYYDFTSLYPDVARNKLPCGKPYYIIPVADENKEESKQMINDMWNYRINQRLLNGKVVFWKVLVRSPLAAEDTPTNPLERKPLFGIKENNTYVFRWFNEWTEMIIYEPELLLAKDHRLDYQFKPINGIVFDEYDSLNACMEKLFVNKSEATSNKQTALAQTWKIIINSLYGVWGLKINGREGIEIARPEHSNWAMDLATENLMDIEKIGKYVVTRRKKDLDVKDCNVAIAAAITSYARIKLYNLFMDVQDRGGKILYCDTDSLITDLCIEHYADLKQKWIGSTNGKALGSLKNEIEECIEKYNSKHREAPLPHSYGFDKAVIVAPKLYYICNKDETIVKKAHKGFKENKEKGDVVTYQRMYKLIDTDIKPEERYLEQTTVQWLGGNSDFMKKDVGVRLVARKKLMYQTINKGILTDNGEVHPFSLNISQDM